MTKRGVLLAAVAATIAAAGGWWMYQAGEGEVGADIAPSALLAATFADVGGQPHSLGQFGGKIVVLNFWATWCAPCREEMPAFVRAQKRWAERGVQFVGLANEDPRRVERFGRDLGIDYPLWVGGENVAELSRRLGNRLGALPHTVILSPTGAPIRSKVGTYSEAELDTALQAATEQMSGKASKSGDFRRTRPNLTTEHNA